MTARQISHVVLVCDGTTCDKRQETSEPTVMAARVLAVAQGWRFVEGRLPGSGTSGQRQFDYCPDCWPTSWHARDRGYP